jgi:hypothetical protein
LGRYAGDFYLLDTCLYKYHDLDVPIEKTTRGEKTNGTASGEKPREEIYGEAGEGNYFLRASVK